MEVVELSRMAEGLSCRPLTLCRLLHSRSTARSFLKEPVCLGLVAPVLHIEEIALSRFLIEAWAKRDKALDPIGAMIGLGEMPRPTFYRYIKEGRIPILVNAGNFTRFSREALRAAMLKFPRAAA